VLVLQEGPERNVLEAAAWDGFASCTTLFLDKLLKSRKLLEDVPKEERPKSIIAKVDMLVTNILPGISDAEKAMIMRKRAGLDRKKKPSLLFMGKNMDHCTGTLDVDDEKDAKAYMTETCQEVSMKEGTLSFMLERKWITQEEYADALPSPKGGDKATKTEKIKVESWDVRYLKKVTPS